MKMKLIIIRKKRTTATYSSGLPILFACLLQSGAAAANDQAPKQQAAEDFVVPTGVVISGSRSVRPLKDTTTAVEMISRREIVNSGAETVADLLEERTGLELTRSYRGAGLRLQGLDEKHVLILMDGERTGGRIGGTLDLSRIPLNSVERVELVKGPSSALYGSDAMGGVVNIITRNARVPRRTQWRVQLGTGGLMDFNASYGAQSNSWASMTTVGWHRAAPYDLNPQDEATTGSGHVMGHVFNRTAYRPNDKLSYVLRTSYLQRDQKGVDANDAGAVFDRRNLTETASFAVEPSYRIDDLHQVKLTTSFRYFRDQYVSDQRNSSALDSGQNTEEKLMQLSAQWTGGFTQQHRYTLGGEGFFEDLQTERLLDGQKDRYRTAIFLQDEWKPFGTGEDAFRLVLGYRWDADSQFGDQHSPKVAVRYMPLESLKLRGSFGRGFRSPDFKELFLLFENPGAGYMVEGAPDLAPERSSSVNLSFEWAVHRRIWWFVNLFHNEIDNLINTTQVANTPAGATKRYTYHNIDTARTQGVETRTRLRLAQSVTLEAGYTLTNARDLTRDRVLSGRARHRATFDLRYRYRPWKVRFTTRGALVGDRPFFVQESEETTRRYVAPSHALVDLRIAKKLNAKFRLFAGIENVLNAGDPTYLPIQPLTWSAGLAGQM